MDRKLGIPNEFSRDYWDGEANLDRRVADHALIADLDPDRAEESRRTGRLQQPMLPSRNLHQHRVCDRAGQIGRDFYAV